MGRFNFMDPGIVSRSGVPVCGPALTVNCRPADNLMVHKALQLAERGDVVVVATGGNTVSAVFGGLMCEAASAKGIGGLVVDGALRDTEDLTRLKFPAFSRTLCAGGCDKDGPGEINVPISCAPLVCPGDLIVGDADGVVVVPHAHAPESRPRQALIDRERARVKEFRRAGCSGPTWTTRSEEGHHRLTAPRTARAFGRRSDERVEWSAGSWPSCLAFARVSNGALSIHRHRRQPVAPSPTIQPG